MASKKQKASNVGADTAVEVASPALAAPKALVFISHDSRDADLAEAFANLLSDVSGGTLKSFRSSDKKGTSGIGFGTEWYAAIMSQLADATDVVALLTPQSLDRPWILYEAGVAKGKLDTTVFGIALGVPLEQVSTGPFGQFQNCGGDEDSLTKLVMQLMQRNPDAAPREEAVRMQVEIFAGKVGKILTSRGKKEPQAQPSDEQNAAKLFEEVKAMVREIPERLDDRVRSLSRRLPGRRSYRVHPRMIEELTFRVPRERVGFAFSWLVVLSIFRDDFPWIYEPGVEFYRALRSGDEAAMDDGAAELHDIIEMTIHEPAFRELLIQMPEDKEALYLLRHLHEIIERTLHEAKSRLARPRPKARASKKAE